MVAEQSHRPTPDADEIADLGQQVKQLAAEVKDYRLIAQEIDDQFERNNEHRRLTLDDMPYGEELIRTRDLPQNLRSAAGMIAKLERGKLEPEQAVEVFEQVATIIEESRAVLDDCTPLPPSSDKDEDDWGGAEDNDQFP